MTEDIGSLTERSRVKIENKIVKGEEVPLNIPYIHCGKYILDSISVTPDAVAQIDAVTGETDTFGDIRDRSVRCAIWLKKQGVCQIDIIGIRTHNQLDTCIPAYAALYLGIPYFPVDDNLDIKSTKHFLSLVSPKIYFVNEESANVMFQAAIESQSDVKIIVLGKYPGAESFSDILAEASEQEVADFKCDEIPNSQHVALIAPTSGTTGMPKGAALPHEYLFRWFQWRNNLKLNLGPILTFSKLGWITANFIITYSAVVRMSRIICTTSMPEVLFDIINKYKPSFFMTSSNMAQEIINSKNANKCDFSSLKNIALAGSQVSSGAITGLRKLAKNAVVSQLYGMTELGGITLEISYTKRNSVGLPLENVHLKIVDIESGEILGPNEKGEICVKSPARMVGYYKNLEATKAVFDTEGFLRTGDIGYYDEDGYIFLLDRLKELIKFRGYHIIPTEIEMILQSHPAVQEAIVVGKRHDTDVEHPVAFVTKVPGRKVTEQELIDIVAKEVMDAKRLRGGVIFLESMPRSSISGKINKSKLKEMLNPIA